MTRRPDSGGWSIQEKLANTLADSVAGVSVSIDGPDAATHNTIRGRAGAFERGMRALDILHRVKEERLAAAQATVPSYLSMIHSVATRVGGAS